jgi:hypothetical protein
VWRAALFHNKSSDPSSSSSPGESAKRVFALDDPVIDLLWKKLVVKIDGCPDQVRA